MTIRSVALWLGSIALAIAVTAHVTREPVEPLAVATTPASTPIRVARYVAAPDRPSAASTRTEPPHDDLFRAAVAQLENDLADGRWSAADRDRLDRALLQVRGEQRATLIEMLFPKLNTRQVISEIDGPPL